MGLILENKGFQKLNALSAFNRSKTILGAIKCFGSDQKRLFNHVQNVLFCPKQTERIQIVFRHIKGQGRSYKKSGVKYAPKLPLFLIEKQLR